jgi:hypothetical protein
MTQNSNLGDRNKHSAPHSENVPLAVDLDGTLLRTDLLLESVFRFIKQKPWLSLLIPFWMLKGRAYLKRRISQ